MFYLFACFAVFQKRDRDRDLLNTSPALTCIQLTGKFITTKGDLDKLEGWLKLKAEPVELWNETQAREKQAGSPKCEESGLVGVWQVMLTLGVTPKLTMEEAQKMSFHRKKDDTSPLPQYLMSCSRHGMTHYDILKAMKTLSSDRIAGRFFEFYPQRRVDIRYWLAGWVKRGVVPLATLNYQKFVRNVSEEERSCLPKDWHHHMIYAVSYHGIHLSNPISKMKAEHFKQRIESESVVLIPRDEVLGRLQRGLNYDLLKNYPEWRQMNVLGQIEVIEREEKRLHSLRIPCGMKHIAIPSSMIGGITLFAYKDSVNHKAIMASEEVFIKI